MKIADIRMARGRLSTSIRSLTGVGPKTALLLDKKGVKTVEDLLYYLPLRYEDRRQVAGIGELTAGEKGSVIGKVIRAGVRYYRKTRVFEAVVTDGSGVLTAKWFGGKANVYLRKTFEVGQRIILTGEVKESRFGKEMAHPDYELIEGEDLQHESLHFNRVVPVYSETEGLGQKPLRKIMRQALDLYCKDILSPIPEGVCKKRHLADIRSSFQNVHFPGPQENIDLYNAWKSPAHERIIYDELFFFELAMARKKGTHATERGISFSRGGSLLEEFRRNLPFTITGAQERVIGEIEKDMAEPCPMHRMVQGDVGCGKTVVAMTAVLRAVENGYQSAIMAPTEILARQHYANVRKWGEALGVKTGLLASGCGRTANRDTIGAIESGDLEIIVGTHALIQDSVIFKKLGLVVIDEQQRFGVDHRRTLREKGEQPDVLVMTATPIPRTLAMTVYGDLDLSIIDEMPQGKGPVLTKVFGERCRQRVHDIIREELKKGNQAFIVYPLVEASAALDLKDATRMAEHLRNDVFPEFRVGLMHGRLGSSEKDRIMTQFSGKELDILVATTIVEVGIDIPDATLMVVEHAERFGLSQLHQLRGRVGRGRRPSRCILLAAPESSERSSRRLQVMEETNDGFRIAEEDLAGRGPGEFMGTKQSGLPDFRIANIMRDSRILQEAREDAFRIIEEDPRLEKKENMPLQEMMTSRWGERLNYAKTG